MHLKLIISLNVSLTHCIKYHESIYNPRVLSITTVNTTIHFTHPRLQQQETGQFGKDKSMKCSGSSLNYKDVCTWPFYSFFFGVAITFTRNICIHLKIQNFDVVTCNTCAYNTNACYNITRIHIALTASPSPDYTFVRHKFSTNELLVLKLI